MNNRTNRRNRSITMIASAALSGRRLVSNITFGNRLLRMGFASSPRRSIEIDQRDGELDAWKGRPRVCFSPRECDRGGREKAEHLLLRHPTQFHTRSGRFVGDARYTAL